MTQTNRGLNLSDVSSVTGQERDEFGAFYTSIRYRLRVAGSSASR